MESSDAQTEELDDEMIITPEKIANLSFYKEIESLIECAICKNIVSEPVQCLNCQNIFCKNCIDSWKKKNKQCPFRCSDNKYFKSKRINELLEKLIIKCECNQNIKYRNYFKHKETECPAIFNDISKLKKMYNILYKKYKKKSQEENTEKNENFGKEIKFVHSQILTSKHDHVLYTVKRPNPHYGWYCNNCNKYFSTQTSFLCSMCDFDLCLKCGRQFFIKGNMEKVNKYLKGYE